MLEIGNIFQSKYFKGKDIKVIDIIEHNSKKVIVTHDSKDNYHAQKEEQFEKMIQSEKYELII